MSFGNVCAIALDGWLSTHGRALMLELQGCALSSSFEDVENS